MFIQMHKLYIDFLTFQFVLKPINELTVCVHAVSGLSCFSKRGGTCNYSLLLSERDSVITAV